MAWIESHQTLRAHPKTRKAARALDIPPVHVIGHLHALWHWALDLADDGDLSKFDADDLAIGAEWEGDPQQFVDALVDCGFGGGPGFLERDGAYGDPEDGLTGALVLHDWWAYAGKLVSRRQRDRKRKSEARSDTTPEDVRGTSNGQAQDVGRTAGKSHTRPDPTQPDQTEPDLTEDHLAKFGEVYPRKDGMKWGGTSLGQVRKSWLKLTGDDREAALAGAKHYADYVAQPGAPIVAMATTWLNQQRWEQFQEPRHVDGQARASPSKGADYAQRYELVAAEMEGRGR